MTSLECWGLYLSVHSVSSKNKSRQKKEEEKKVHFLQFKGNKSTCQTVLNETSITSLKRITAFHYVRLIKTWLARPLLLQSASATQLTAPGLFLCRVNTTASQDILM